MKKILASTMFLLISSYSYANDALSFNSENYRELATNKVYQTYINENNKIIKDLKHISNNESMDDFCLKNSYCIPKNSNELAELDGNLVSPKLTELLKSYEEIDYLVFKKWRNEKNKLIKNYNENDFKQKYLPAFKDYIEIKTNEIILISIIKDNISEQELNKILVNKKSSDISKLIAKATLIYFEKGDQAKEDFINEKVMEIANKEKLTNK